MNINERVYLSSIITKANKNHSFSKKLFNECSTNIIKSHHSKEKNDIEKEEKFMSKNIYTTKEYKGYGKQNYYWNEYRQQDDHVEKVKCHRQKSFDGKESNWDYEENVVDSWKTNDSSMPEWLSKFIDKK